MGFANQLEKMMQNSDPDNKNQLMYILKKLSEEPEDNMPSDEEECGADETDDEISYYEEDAEEDKEINANGLPKGEDLLLGEFLASTDDAMQQSKTIAEKLAVKVSESAGENQEIKEGKQNRPTTPIGAGEENPIKKAAAADARIPSAMRARPKIPRTPIPVDKIEQAKKESEELFKNVLYVRNENSNKKKQLAKHHESERVEGKTEAAEEKKKLLNVANRISPKTAEQVTYENLK